MAVSYVALLSKDEWCAAKYEDCIMTNAITTATEKFECAAKVMPRSLSNFQWQQLYFLACTSDLASPQYK